MRYRSHAWLQTQQQTQQFLPLAAVLVAADPLPPSPPPPPPPPPPLRLGGGQGVDARLAGYLESHADVPFSMHGPELDARRRASSVRLSPRQSDVALAAAIRCVASPCCVGALVVVINWPRPTPQAQRRCTHSPCHLRASSQGGGVERAPAARDARRRAAAARVGSRFTVAVCQPWLLRCFTDYGGRWRKTPEGDRFKAPGAA